MVLGGVMRAVLENRNHPSIRKPPSPSPQPSPLGRGRRVGQRSPFNERTRILTLQLNYGLLSSKGGEEAPFVPTVRRSNGADFSLSASGGEGWGEEAVSSPRA